MSLTAIIGGTGLTELQNLEITHKESFDTPFGEPSGPLTFGNIGDTRVVFLARHGYQHTIPPHKVNYRANLWALKQAGVSKVIAVAAVGGITGEMMPERIVIPDQIIDYTYGRSQTYFEDELEFVTHIDFTHPYDAYLRDLLINTARELEMNPYDGGVYAATQGPRLETAAEIEKLRRDGCDIVGMTGMPEAALARELGLDYAACAVIANWAAGCGGQDEITMEEIERCLHAGMARVRQLLENVLPKVNQA